MNVTIANYKGSTLPETGGAGTTMLYTAGAVLCCGAVVIFLASKKAQRD
jgi:LPXTG-motif cell wall-anchored protein